MATKYLDNTGLAYFWGKIKSWVTSRGYITSSGSITGNAGTATKLATARSISAGDLEFQGSANFDGSGNIALNVTNHRCIVSVSNTNYYPFHRIAYVPLYTGSWNDRGITFLVSKDYHGGGYGIARIIFRTNKAASQVAQCSVQWLSRTSDIAVNAIQVGFVKTAGASYLDVFYHSDGTYNSAVCRVLAHANARNGVCRGFTVVSASTEESSTTATDPKTSVESYKTIADAGTALHNQAYTDIIAASDVGVAGKLATARKIFGLSFDGSADIGTYLSSVRSIEFTDIPSNAGYGGVIDFHYNGSTSDYTSRIIEGSSGVLHINGVTINTDKVVSATSFSGELSGNAGTATKLKDARTISLTGDVSGSASFDGSANASITATVADDSHNHVISNVDGLQTALDGKAADSAVVHLAGAETITGAKTFSSEVNISTANALRMKSSSYGAFFRNDNSSFYLLVTASGDADGTWTTARPLTVNLATGVCSINGNAATATSAGKVSTTVAVGTTGELVKATMGSNDAFRIAVGGSSNAGWAEIATADDYSEPIYVRQYQGGFATLKREAKLLDGSGNTSFPGTVTANAFSGPLTGNVTGNCSGSSGSCTGNAATATEFASAQSVALTGDVTGSASSQAGWSVATTLANSGVTAGRYTSVNVDAKGRVTAGNVKHSYTTAANATKNWYRIANANTQQLDTSKPIRAQFIVTAYNTSYAADYYETWFVNAIVFGRTAHISIFGGTSIPFSQARILYENTVANIDANDRPAIDLYLNYVLPNGTTKIEVEEIYNSGWTFLADGQLVASSVPSGFESVAGSVRNNGVERSTYADYVSYLNRQISNFTAAFTLADTYLYRSRTLNCTGTFTITVPSINSGYMWCVIKNKNATSGVITLHPSTTSVLIDNSNADITLQPGEYVCIHSAGANNYSLISDGRWKSQKANASHNQASNTINAMTGYSKPSSTSAITATDSLNVAVGKLEKEDEYLHDEFLLVKGTADNCYATTTAHQLLIEDLQDALDTMLKTKIYPVGSTFFSLTDSRNPATILGFGTWAKIEGKFLLGASSSYAADSTGGEATHTLTESEMPKHYHDSLRYKTPTASKFGCNSGTLSDTSWTVPYASGKGQDYYVTGNTGGSQAHNNMPPYLAGYLWRRTA